MTKKQSAPHRSQHVPVHHHSLILARCRKDPGDEGFSDELKAFMNDFIVSIGMHVLIEPRIQLGRFGFTGIAGIVTSHVAFHYFESNRTLQFDIYSCRSYNLDLVLRQIDSFWQIRTADVVFLDRSSEVKMTRFIYERGELKKLGTAVWDGQAEAASSQSC
jgi:S-adenosylmethionine/arginine decarboxylase-like enzyme